MSRYNKQNRLDEKAVSVISDFFMYKHGEIFDLQFHGIKDNTPDTDGFIRLREKDINKSHEGKYLNQVVFFQLKGQEKAIENHTYRCSKKLIEFCRDINLPTILIVVGDLNPEAEKRGYTEIYWYHFSSINTEILDDISAEGSSTVIIPNLESLKIGDKDSIESFYSFIRTLAKKNALLDLPKEMFDLTVDYKDKLVILASILYLLGKLEKKNKSSIRTILDIKQKEIDSVLVDLKRKGLISFNNKTIIFKQIKDEFKRDIGLLLCHEAITKIDLDKMFEIFSDHSEQLNIYKNLSKIKHPVIDKRLNLQATRLEKKIRKLKTNDKILEELELLEQYAYRIPKKVLKIIKFIVNSKTPISAKKKRVKGYGTLLAKSHEDLILKCIEILNRISYLEMKEIFALLVKLSSK